jgi:hypothetical protein
LLLGGAFGEWLAAAPTGGEIQRCQAEPVGIGFVLICARQRTVQVGEDAYLYRSRTTLIGREEAFEDCRRRPCLVGGQNQQG